jgi:SAM-dependent methyltransferase
VKTLLLGTLGRLRLLRPAYRGYEALRSAVAPRGNAAAADDGLPLPPSRLIVRVAGTADVGWFLEGGRLAAASVADALGRRGAQVDELGSILDFGCGCGRVVRRWAGLAATAVAGSDMNEGAIEWCRRNLPFARFEVNKLEPPLAFDPESFDLVYALSVFTHLPEELERRWIDELTRVLRPGGFLLLSTHGEAYLPRLTPSERERFAAGELVVRRPEAAGTNLCTTFHPPRYVQETLAGGFEPLEFIPEGATGNPHQDLFLLRKP